jgi:hypothetical protein
MAYSFRDHEKELGHGLSNSALISIRELIANGTYPAMETLITHGYTKKLAAIATECLNLKKKTTDLAIQDQLQNIVAMAKKADEVLILTH